MINMASRQRGHHILAINTKALASMTTAEEDLRETYQQRNFSICFLVELFHLVSPLFCTINWLFILGFLKNIMQDIYISSTLVTRTKSGAERSCGSAPNFNEMFLNRCWIEFLKISAFKMS